MIKISKALKEIVEKNPTLKFGLSYRLFNLTQLAKFITPQLKALTKKEVQSSAIVMNLSRLQKQMSKIAPKPETVHIEKISIHTDLHVFTYTKTSETREKLSKLQNTLTVTKGNSEITIIIKKNNIKDLKKLIKENPKNEQSDIVSIGITFTEEYGETPGFVHLVLQQLSLQYINIVEIASTYTELFLYIDKKDAKLAMDTLLHSFQSS
jgi:aspartokinase